MLPFALKPALPFCPAGASASRPSCSAACRRPTASAARPLTPLAWTTGWWCSPTPPPPSQTWCRRTTWKVGGAVGSSGCTFMHRSTWKLGYAASSGSSCVVQQNNLQGVHLRGAATIMLPPGAELFVSFDPAFFCAELNQAPCFAVGCAQTCAAWASRRQQQQSGWHDHH